MSEVTRAGWFDNARNQAVTEQIVKEDRYRNAAMATTSQPSSPSSRLRRRRKKRRSLRIGQDQATGKGGRLRRERERFRGDGTWTPRP